MKIFTSYFYQIRNFKPYMIPLSTAVWDPKWYHQNSRDKSIIYLDKNGVYNGTRVEPLVPGSDCEFLCKGREVCKDDPDSCEFLKRYKEQISRLNISQFLDSLKELEVLNKTNHETYIVLIFYETPDNPCSERIIVTDWLRTNGVDVKELFQ